MRNKFIHIIFVLVISILFMYIFCISMEPTVSFRGGGYTFRRYPKFCCDTDPKPIIKSELSKQSLDKDTKFLYKVMSNPKMRAIVIFDGPTPKGGSWAYEKIICNITQKQGRNIYYQIAIMNDYDIDDYPKKDNYKIQVYFTCAVCEDNGHLIIKNFYNTVLAAKLFLNKNSIDILKYQDLNRFNNFKMRDSRIKFNTLLNLMNDKLTLFEQEKLIAIHGMISYMLGLRNMSDIDMNCNNDEEVVNKMNVTLDFELDIMNINPDSSDINTIQYISKIKSIINTDNINCIFTDPNNYFYFYGLKCISLDINMKSRYIRQRPNAIAEIIAFNLKNPNNKYDLPEIPTYTLTFDKKSKVYPNSEPFLQISREKKEKIKELVNKEGFLIGILRYLKTNYQVFEFKSIDQLEKLFT